MDKVNEALQRICSALNSTDKIETSIDDWRIIFDHCEGSDYIETVNNLQNFIADNFSFEIKETEGLVYFGSVDDSNKIPVYKVMDAYSNHYPEYYGYISSTQAGKLFNDGGFSDALKEWAMNAYVDEDIVGFENKKTFYYSLFDGKDASGYIGTIKSSDNSATDKISVRAFNDFFSANYIDNLKCSNVSTVFFGSAEKGGNLNCFGRTEFDRLMHNDNILTINGVDKYIYQNIYDDALGIFKSEKEAMGYVCESLKMTEIKNFNDVHFTYYEKNGIWEAHIVPKPTIDSISLAEMAVGNGKVSPMEINDFYKKYGEQLSDTSKIFFKNNIEVYNREIFDICLDNGEDMLRVLGKDEIDIGAWKLCRDGSIRDSNGLTVRKVSDTSNDIHISSSGKTVTIIFNGISIGMELWQAGTTLNDVVKQYTAGNYRTGCKEAISYTSQFLGVMVGTAAMDGLFYLAAGAAFGPVGIAALFVMGLLVDEAFSGIGEEIGDVVGDWVCDLLGYTDADYDAAGSAVRYVADPLVIDLDGDGFDLLSLPNGVYFDENAEGLKEKTQWTDAKDALLAIDLNGDGFINNGSELFGTSTMLADGSKARFGFEALSQYDENSDGIIDENDAVYSRLLVWQDMNSDGISQSGELVSLQEAGIKSISLAHYDESGRQISEIEFADGRKSKIGEFNFEAQLYNAKEFDEIEISEEIRSLANVHAIGNVASLHTMMQMDKSGVLKEYVKAFAQADTVAQREEVLTKILYKITGADNVAPDSRGSQFDAQKLAVIEAFMGRDFVGTAGRNPVNTAATILNGVYSNLYEIYYNLMNAETSLKDYLKTTFWIKDKNGNRYLDTSFFYAYIDYCRKDGQDMTSVVADMGRYIASINASNKDNYVDYLSLYGDSSEYVEAISKHCPKGVLLGIGDGEKVHAGNDDTYLVGIGENNYLYGGRGNDHLIGGKGNDILYGGEGNDTYIFNLGDGKDLVYDYECSQTEGKDDRIVFGEGIRAEDIRLKREGSSLVIDYSENDRVTVQRAYYYSDDRCSIERMEFADGTVLTPEDVKEMLKVKHGTDASETLQGYGAAYAYDEDETFYAGAGDDRVNAGTGNDTVYGEEGNDTLYGGYGDDYLDGGEGDDQLYGEYGDDILTGGTGNDYLDGGYGNDTYIFNLGDGKDSICDGEYSQTEGKEDRIVFGEGIKAEDIRLKREGSSLVIEYSDSDSDSVTVQNAYRYNDDRYFVEHIEFADGSVLTPEDMERMLKVKQGTEESETLQGYGAGFHYDENEIFYAGAGDDRVNAGTGNDTVYGEEGNDTLYGGYGDDYLDGGEGNDYLYGEYGDDILTGGTGNDYLDGGYGNDTYTFNLGDGKDLVYDYECSQTEGKDDRIVFGEGIRAEDIRLKREGSSLVIDYSENDRVTVQRAYYYSDDRCSIERMEFADGTVLTPEDVKEMLKVKHGTDASETLQGYGAAYAYDEDETFYAGAGDDRVNAGSGDDTVYGEEGNDTLYGGYGDDYMDGGEGNDYLYGEYGDDILTGGTGNDYLDGGYGNDTYTFNLGDGKDLVYDYECSQTEGKDDRIVFGEGIRAEDIRLKREGSSLVIDYSENDRVTVQRAYYYSDDRCSIERMEFADGTVLAPEDVKEMLKVKHGTDASETLQGYGAAYAYDENEIFYAGGGGDRVNAGTGNDTVYGEEGNDTLYGGYGDDYLDGGEGNDTLYGENGDDVLTGGTGNDYLDGGYGNDTYTFNLGDGKDLVYDYECSQTEGKDDRIVFGEGIRAEDIRLKREGSSLVIEYSENDRVTVQDAYRYNDDRCSIERMEFADGTVLAPEDVKEMLKVKHGTDASETLQGYGAAYAYDEDETFYAGAGDDRVNAGSGDDTVYGEEGNDTLYGGYGDDYMDGGEGNDTLYGEYGDDVLIGGAGNDTLDGGTGNDTYIFNLGDGKDTVYDYECSQTEGKEDRIVFGEGIRAEDIRLKREGYNLVIDYSENDRVTVQNAYRYNDDRCFVEHIEFADGSKGTIDYGNTQLDITVTPTDIRDISESQMIGMQTNKTELTEGQPAGTDSAETLLPGTQSDEMQTTDTSMPESVETAADDTVAVDNGIDLAVSDDSMTKTVPVQGEDSGETAIGQESMQETVSTEQGAVTETDVAVDNCVEILENLYASNQIPEETTWTESPGAEQSSAIYDNPTDTAIDNIVNLLVQDMSESGAGAVSDTASLTDVTTVNDNVQLWVS